MHKINPDWQKRIVAITDTGTLVPGAQKSMIATDMSRVTTTSADLENARTGRSRPERIWSRGRRPMTMSSRSWR